MNLFDSAAAERARDEGMTRAAEAEKNKLLLRIAQSYAKKIAVASGTATADDVARAMEVDGLTYSCLGNAAGSVFRGMQWTGEFVRSARVSTHARMIRVWRMK